MLQEAVTRKAYIKIHAPNPCRPETIFGSDSHSANRIGSSRVFFVYVYPNNTSASSPQSFANIPGFRGVKLLVVGINQY
jgi:hypothetical protein